MAGGPQRKIEVFGTCIMSSNKIRSNHDKVTRILSQAKLIFEFHDLSSSEELKLRYKKIMASNHVKNPELPFILSGGEVVGTADQLEEAVEYGELRQFLLLDKPIGKTQDDELLGQLSAAELKELSGDLSASSHPAAQKVANEVQDLTGEGHVESPIEPVPTPVGFHPSQPLKPITVPENTDGQALREGQQDRLLSQMTIGKDEVALKKENELNHIQTEANPKDSENDVPSLAAARSSISNTLQEKVEANPTPAMLGQ
ncbi:hypothetical protein CROQUDRAFT_651651 [Cronartium quercuum f. sp. fusiforme G11]|uniref:Glutaredoxin domain-containing protein n=1 Tax=Cronartium quercuum f. sp. fusiforme G11 TaxID=708437 RepID=A0A9P6TG59_9BASI|nr:hypothetical protein CROQUDRAFT_651651 [Cronartium quercuum f. sp. fusiforme G11]